MKTSNGFRRFHRWTSVVFTLAVLTVFTANAVGGAPEWVNYLPLPPLFALTISGFYLFALPYLARSRR